MLNIISLIKNKLNLIQPFYLIILYILISLILILLYTKQVNYNINLLIHLNQNMLELNPEMKFKNLIILKDEGYDGQFYYFISRYIYDKNITNLVLDSTYFRMLRIGSSLLYGIIPSILGWEYYTYWVLILHIILFCYSFLLFYKILPSEKKYLSIIYLFNPFTIISNMLLIGDTIFISLFMIFIFLLYKCNFSLNQKKQIQFNKYYFLSILISILLILTKETLIFYLLPLCILFLLRKDFRGIFLILFTILIFIIWYKVIPIYFNFTDLNPIKHTNRIRLPFHDYILFYFSSLNKIHTIYDFFKFIPYIIIFLLHISLLLQLKNFIPINKNLFKQNFSSILQNTILYIPIGLVFIIITMVDLEYWLAFDNIFRIFTFAFLWMSVLEIENKFYKNYGFYFFSILITFLLLFRYSIIKKIGAFTIL
ncbi:MAG: hypothetical protein KatS3mg129_1829 [Leptospiraceae bacterium]|nr:MAG: hypothetical protein KatS3mg129_1829 [Leptospiraceae bacterium]